MKFEFTFGIIISLIVAYGFFMGPVGIIFSFFAWLAMSYVALRGLNHTKFAKVPSELVLLLGPLNVCAYVYVVHWRKE